MRSLIAALGVAAACASPAAAAAVSAAATAPSAAATMAAPGVAAPAARTVCRPEDRRIDEASGIAVGIASPGVRYVMNDSGDASRFFALDARTCRTIATISVRGARNVDWEDIAVARDAAGTPSVWLADIGDNEAARDHVTVYRVPEPRLDADGPARRSVSVADTWRLRYPGGPADAESLAVAPGGIAYVVTKSWLGTSSVYRLPTRPTGSVRTVERVAQVQLTPVGTSRFGVGGALLATGAAFSGDGTRFVIRTYSGAFVWTVPGGDLAAALRTRPVTVALPPQPQGEGVAVDGSRLLLDSEGVSSAVLSVPLPVTSATTRSGGEGAAASSATPESPTSSTSSTSSPSTARSGSTSPSKKGRYGSAGSWIPGIVILGVLIVGSVWWWSGQRPRKPRGPAS